MSQLVKVNLRTLAPVRSGGGEPLYLTVRSTDGKLLFKLELNRSELIDALNSGFINSTCTDDNIGGRIVT